MISDSDIEENPSRNPVKQAQKFIRANLYQPLTIESVAGQVFISRARLAERFRIETGQTFLQYLTQCRVAEAKMLLRDSDWAISTIAGFVGFKAASSFQRFFRQQVGLTPTQYRQKSKLEK